MTQLLYSPKYFPEQTYADAFLVPNNPILEQLLELVTVDEIAKLVQLHTSSINARNVSRKALRATKGKGDPTLKIAALEAHTKFRDYVLNLSIKYPEIAKSVSRDEVDFTPPDGFGNTPIKVSNMNEIAGKRNAEGTGMVGAAAAIPQDKSDEEMKEIAGYLHSRDVRYMTPVTVRKDTKVHEFQQLIQKRDLDTAVVTDAEDKFIGLVRMQEQGQADHASGVVPKGVNPDMPIESFIRTEGCVTSLEGTRDEDLIKLMDASRIHFVPIVTADGKLKGVVTRKFLGMRWRYKPHVDHEHGGLAMLATVGALNKNPLDRVRFLIDIGVRGIVFDTAHFDQGTEPYKNVKEAAGIIAKRNGTREKIHLIAGNVVTRRAVRDIFAAGADIAKVGIGPGAMCETRMETGVGRPQLSAVLQCADEAKIYGKNIWADGGIQYPRDVALALAAGASQVMIGSLFAATVESPPPFEHDPNGRLFKITRGMASRQAATLRNFGRLEQDMRDVFRSVVGQRSEGLSEGRVYQRPGIRSTADLVHYIVDGLTSTMTYVRAKTIDQLQRHSIIGFQTVSGYDEGKPKPVL